MAIADREKRVGSDETVAAIRDFNRFYTKVAGVLPEEHLGSGHSLAEARVVYELGMREETETAQLRQALDLDRGYVSRLLSRLEDEGVVRRSTSAADARRQTIALTAAGRRLLATLQRRSSERVEALIADLHESDRQRLLAAMAEIRALLEPRERPRRVVLREPRIGDVGWTVERNGVHYSREWDWDLSFEALVAKIVGELLEDADPRRERGWIAEVDGSRAGSVFCGADDGETARLRMLFVEPWARGGGVGTLLVDECVSFARAAGYRKLVLWTTDRQRAARRLYEATGFRLVASTPAREFGQDLSNEDWELELRP